jgi:hypothetical protein
MGLASDGWSVPQEAARPTILNVTSEMLATGEVVLVITGVGFGETPAVTVDGQVVPVLAGASDTQLSVLAPATVLATPGTYRLTVTDPVRQLGDAFVVVSLAGPTAVAVAPLAGVSTGPGTATSVSTGPGTGVLSSSSSSVLPLAGGGTGLGLVEDTGSPFRTAVGYQALANTSGVGNTASGFQALLSNTAGTYNTASGYHALLANTTGIYNTAHGSGALWANTTGNDNTASGLNALFSNTEGHKNTATGSLALVANTTGSWNMANGQQALAANTTGYFNTASGFQALVASTVGDYNTASGAQALGSNTTGSRNTASGSGALAANTTGYFNTASGYGALMRNVTGQYNSAGGYMALSGNTTGSDNTALGIFAGESMTVEHDNTFIGAVSDGAAGVSNATAIGFQAQVTQSNSVVLGSVAGANGASVTANVGIGTTAPTARLHVVGDVKVGDYLTGANNVVMGAGTALPTWSGNVELNNESGVGFHFRALTTKFDIGPGSGGAPTYPGLLTLSMDGKVGIGTTSPSYKLHVVGDVYATGTYHSSDSRLKDQVQDVGYGVREVLRLRPVSYRWKDAALGQPTLGLIAQEVQPVLPELVARGTDEAGLLSLNYTGLIPVLVKAIQEQQHTVAELLAENTALKSEMRTVRAQLAALEEQMARLLKQEEKPQPR